MPKSLINKASEPKEVGSDNPREETFMKMLTVNLCPSFKACSFTSLLVILNVMLFVYAISTFGIQPNGSLLQLPLSSIESMGGNFVNLVTVEKQYYRLLLSAFVHVNLLHLLTECVFIIIIISSFEYCYGSVNTAVIFLIACITSNSVADDFAGLDDFSIGTSQIFTAFFASVIGYFILNWKQLECIAAQREYLLCFYILLLTLPIMMMSSGGSLIQTYAQLASVLSGILLGMAVPQPISNLQNTNRLRIISRILLALLLILSLFSLSIH